MSTKNFAYYGDLETLFSGINTKKVSKSSTAGLLKNDGTVDTNKYVKADPYFVSKTWSGLTDFNGTNIWTDGENIYYSALSTQKVLNKATSTWSDKTWNGLTSFYGDRIWTDGENVYYSNSNDQKILNKATSTWSEKTWNGLTSFRSAYIWTDGENIYYSNGSDQYVLDKTTSTWSEKTWSGLTDFNGQYVWTDGENIYYSKDANQYVLNKATSTWSAKTWIRLTYFDGKCVWTDGENIYYSKSSSNAQFILDRSTSTWKPMNWNETIAAGTDIWTDGENIYYSGSSTQYQLKTDLDSYAKKKDVKAVSDRVDDIDELIPSSASSSNKLATANDIPLPSKKRYTVTASNWSNSTDASGYYTYTMTLSNPTLSMSYAPEVLPAGANDNTFYTDTEKENFDKLEQCDLTASNTLVLYAKDKPSVTFYVWVKGLES